MTFKQTLLSTMLVVLCFAENIQAQVVFSEDFSGLNGVFPVGWTRFNVDALTPATNVAYVNNAWIVRDDLLVAADTVAISTSWYNPAGTSNDWMFTPAIAVPVGTPILTWDAIAYDASYADGYEVRIMTAAPTVGNIMTSTVLLSVAAEASVITPHSVSLSAYAGQTVYIGFRNNSTDKFVLAIDDVVVENAIPNTADLATSNPVGQYTMIPVSQLASMPLSANVSNSGPDNVPDAILTCNVFQLPNLATPIYTATGSVGTNINSAASAVLTAGNYTLPGAGTFVLKYFANSATKTDLNTANDTATYEILVSNAYARDNGVVTGSLGIGAGAAANGILGQNYNIVNNAQVDSVMIYLNNGGAGGNTMVGQPVSLSVYSTTAGTPNTSLATSNVVTITTTGPQWVKLTFTTPLSLTPGTYYFGVHEADSNVTLATTPAIFTAGAGWVNWATNPNGAWSNSEDFGFNVAYILRPFLSAPCAITANASVTSNYNGAQVSCNGGANGEAMASASGGVGSATYMWSNGQTTISATGLAAGVYTVTATAGCSDVASVTITEPAALTPVPDSFALDVLCNGDATGYIYVTIIGGTTPYNYLWSNGATTDDLVGLGAGIYSGTATDINGCTTGGVFTVTEPSVLTSAAVDNADGTATASASGGSPTYTYMWDATAGNQTTATATGLMTNTYSVTITDLNGCMSVASVSVVFTGIDNIATLNTLSMFPNPTTANVFVDLDLTANQDVAIRIVNVTGQTVLENNVGTVRTQRVELATSELPTGVYMVQFFIGTEMTTRKLVVEK